MHICSNVSTIIKKIVWLCNHQKIKFLFAGGLNTVFGYSIYVIFVFVGIPYLVSLLMATILGVIFNYHSFGRIVFPSLGGMVAFRRFIAAYSTVYLINAIALEMLTNNLQLGPYAAQVICISPSIIMNWVLMNYWVFKRS